MTKQTRWTGAVTLAAVVATVSFGLGAATVRRRSVIPPVPMDSRERAERTKRVRLLDLDDKKLGEFIAKHGRITRAQLINDGYLLGAAPAHGTKLIAPEFRNAKGEELLRQAKDVLFALLFGDEAMNVRLGRTERELLTLTVPRAKVTALEFIQASTPDDVSGDERADNVIIEVEYGEMACEMVGDGIVAALRLINLLEVNEQILHGRMTNIEQSTLVN